MRPINQPANQTNPFLKKIDINKEASDAVKNKYADYTNDKESEKLFKYKIYDPPIILNVSRVGGGKSYTTSLILRDFV